MFVVPATTFMVMTFVKFPWSASSVGRFDYGKAQSICSLSLYFQWPLVTLGKDGRGDDDPRHVLTERCVTNEEGDWFLLHDVKFLCHGVLDWFLRQEVSSCRLAVHWCIRSVQSVLGTKLQVDDTCIVLRPRRKMDECQLMSLMKGPMGNWRWSWVSGVLLLVGAPRQRLCLVA